MQDVLAGTAQCQWPKTRLIIIKMLWCYWCSVKTDKSQVHDLWLALFSVYILPNMQSQPHANIKQYLPPPLLGPMPKPEQNLHQSAALVTNFCAWLLLQVTGFHACSPHYRNPFNWSTLFWLTVRVLAVDSFVNIHDLHNLLQTHTPISTSFCHVFQISCLANNEVSLSKK